MKLEIAEGRPNSVTIKEWNDWFKEVILERPEVFEDGFSPDHDYSDSTEDHDKWKTRAQVKLEGQTYSAGLDLSNLNMPFTLYINDCDILGDLELNPSRFGSRVKIENCRVSGNIIMTSGSSSSTIELVDVKVSGSITITNCSSKALYINRSKIGVLLTCYENRFEQFHCNSLEVSQNFYCIGNSCSSIALRYCDFKEATFHSTAIVSADFTGSTLLNSNFSAQDLSGANFSRTNLAGSNFLGSNADTSTDFSLSKLDRCVFSRFTLECLHFAKAPSTGMRMRMNIRDDVASLRRRYSGINRWIHIVALAVFAFPYIWFVVMRWSEASFLYLGSNSIELWKALSYFIYSGGKSWSGDPEYHFSFLIFIAALIYNAVRAFLLWKTKSLEFQEVTSGVPSNFTFESSVVALPYLRKVNWNWLLNFSSVFEFIYLALTLLNTYHFLNMRVLIVN